MGTRIVVEERGFQKKDRYRQGLGTNTNLCFNTLQEPVRSLLSHRSQLKLTHSKQNVYGKKKVLLFCVLNPDLLTNQSWGSSLISIQMSGLIWSGTGYRTSLPEAL